MGAGILYVPPASCIFYSRFPYLLLPLPAPFRSGSRSPLCPISIAKYHEMLRNFPRFFPVPATFGLPLPALFSPASRPFSPGLPPSCPTPPNSQTNSSWFEQQYVRDIVREKSYNIVHITREFAKNQWRYLREIILSL